MDRSHLASAQAHRPHPGQLHHRSTSNNNDTYTPPSPQTNKKRSAVRQSNGTATTNMSRGGAHAAGDSKKWSGLQSRLHSIREKQKHTARVFAHRTSRAADDTALPSSSSSLVGVRVDGGVASLRSGSSQTNLLTCLEELKHGFTYPIQTTIITSETFYGLVKILIEIITTEHEALRRAHEHGATPASSTTNDPSSVDTSLPSTHHDDDTGTCSFACQEVEQFKLNIGMFFQFLLTCMSRKQIQISTAPQYDFIDPLIQLFHELMDPPPTARATGGSWVNGWMRLDGFRVLAQVLSGEAREELERTAGGSTGIEKKPTTTKPTPAPSVLPSKLVPHHPSILRFLMPYVDSRQLPKLAQLSAASNAVATGTGVLDAVEAQQRLFVQLEYRRIAMQCIAHLAGKTMSTPVTTVASPSIVAPLASTRIPSPAFAVIFSSLCQSLEFYHREASVSVVWISLLDASLKAIAACVEDACIAAGNTNSGLSSTQAAELTAAITSLPAVLHKQITWGVSLVLQPDHIAPPAAAVASCDLPAPASSANSAGSTMARSNSHEQLTPRAAIGPPSTQSLGTTNVAAASLFSGSSFALLTGEHWRALHSRYTLESSSSGADGGGSGGSDQSEGFVSGWTSAGGGETSGAEDAPATYQSRVRGPKPSRPSNVTLAIAASRIADGNTLKNASGSVHSSSSDSSRQLKLAHAAASEKVRSHCLQCLQSLAKYAPKMFHSHWVPFIPTDGAVALSSRPFAGPSIMTVILHDPSPKVRSLAAAALATMLVDSPLTRWTGAMAETTAGARIRKNREAKEKKSGGFTSLSVRFGDALRGLHIGLLECLKRETIPSVLTQTLKTISVLVLNTPYQTMQQTNTNGTVNGQQQEGLLVPIVDHLLTHMLHEASSYVSSSSSSSSSQTPSSKLRTSRAPLNPTLPSVSPVGSKSDLRHAIFSCLATIFDTTAVITELRPFLKPITTKGTYHVDAITLFLSHARARRPTDPTPDAFTILAKIARHYPESLSNYWRWHSDTSSIGTNMAGSLSHLLKECLGLIRLPATSSLHGASTTSPTADIQTQLLALKILEEWNKTDSSASSTADASANHDAEDDDGNGGNFEPLPTTGEGFFTLDGARIMIARELLKVYRDSNPPVTPSPTPLAPTPTPSELHAQKQLVIASGNVRAKVLACLALLPWKEWKQLNQDEQHDILRTTIMASQDQVPTVRTAACRCLCLFALYSARSVAVSSTPSSESATSPESVDLTPRGFIHAAVSQLLVLLDPANSLVIGVRVRAAWSLANIADFGSESSTATDGLTLGETQSIHQLLTPHLYAGMITRLLSATSDNDKVLSNAVRAVGNLARWFSFESDGSIDTFRAMIRALLMKVHTARSPKSKWNVCHALGNVIRNAHLPILLARSDSEPACASLRTDVRQSFDTLVDVVRDEKVEAGTTSTPTPTATTTPIAGSKDLTVAKQLSNFKVRINAAAALAITPSMAHYAGAFKHVLDSLLGLAHTLLVDDGLSSSSSPSGTFTNFKYMTHLRQELLAAICHMLGLFDATEQQCSEMERRELLQLYVREFDSISKLLLGERLRWETEWKQLARAERLGLQAAASQAGATRTTANKALPVVTYTKSTIQAAQQRVERAATAVERVMAVIEAGGSHPGLAARFAAQANGEINDVFPSAASNKMAQ